MRPPHFCRVRLILPLLLGLSRLAVAQSDQERSAARAAAEQGMQAYSAGNWQKAVVYLRKAQSIFDAPTHLLYIARAEAKLNHLVEAREAYIKLDRTTLAPNVSDAFRQAKQSGIDELPAIEARLPYITLIVTGGSATQLLVDETEMSVTAVGVPFPINPGEHVFQAMSESLASEQIRESFLESAKKTLELHLASVRPSGAAVGSFENPGKQATSSTTMSHPKDGSAGLKIGEYIAYGAGVLGVGTGIYFVIKWSNAANEADQAYSQFVVNQCRSVATTDCRNQAAHVSSLDREAAHAGTISTVGYAIGAAGLGTGLAMMLLRQGHEEQLATEQLHAYLGPRSAGIWGRF